MANILMNFADGSLTKGVLKMEIPSRVVFIANPGNSRRTFIKETS